MLIYTKEDEPMSSYDNSQINAAYIAFWKQKNSKLNDLETDGYILKYKNEQLRISEIYMQDILRNPNIFYNMDIIEGSDLFKIIKVHTYAMQLKELELEEKVRRYNEYEYTN